MADLGTLNPSLQPEPDMLLMFADGEQCLPGWMVEHLGGRNKVALEVSKFAGTVSYEEFTRQFFEAAAAGQIREALATFLGQRSDRFQ